MAGNFRISGETLNSDSNRRNQNQNNFTTLNSIGMLQQCSMAGVYMINGDVESVTSMYPVYSSAKDLNYVGIPKYYDDAYLVYPSFGFKLYQDVNYGGSASNTYYNTSSSPVVFVLGTDSWSGAKKRVYYEGKDNVSGETYPDNSTGSIKIYFRGPQLTMTGIS